jgi:hypothetical protein
MDPARMFKESLTSRLELENSQGHSRPNWAIRATSAFPLIATEPRTSRIGSFGPILLQKSVAADVAVDHFAMSGRL